MALANTLAYYDTTKNYGRKMFSAVNFVDVHVPYEFRNESFFAIFLQGFEPSTLES
jgi:hypothetical protein